MWWWKDLFPSCSQQLADLTEKYGNLVVRPGSPFPRKDQLLKMVDTIARKKIRDENDIIALKKLITEQDELVYAAFDVFDSDHDEDDLIDTLMRILKSYQKKNRLETYTSPYETYNSRNDYTTLNNGFQKRKQEEEDREKAVLNYENQNSESGQFSYFLGGLK